MLFLLEEYFSVPQSHTSENISIHFLGYSKKTSLTVYILHIYRQFLKFTIKIASPQHEGKPQVCFCITDVT